MNILPKKRWHVRTKANIERVRKDEAKAAEEEKELQRRIELAEQEARTDLLRKRARTALPSSDETTARTVPPSSEEPSHSDGSNKQEHVNFFKDLEETGKYVGGINKEHEAEKKADQEKFERNIGLLTYLGESSVEATGSAQWYLQTVKRKSKHDENESDSDDDIINKKQKAVMDPLYVMNQYLSQKKKGARNKGSLPQNEKCEEPQKCKYSRPKTPKTIEQLRAERIQRERKEHERSQQLLKKLTNGEEKEPEVIYDDRLRKYNSQFNPHLAKNPLPFARQQPLGRNGGYPKKRDYYS